MVSSLISICPWMFRPRLSSGVIYPGADGSFLLYEDDGKSFDYKKGAWMGVQMKWNDAARKLSLRLADGSRMLAAKQKKFEVKLGEATKSVTFDGKPIEVSL